MTAARLGPRTTSHPTDAERCAPSSRLPAGRGSNQTIQGMGPESRAHLYTMALFTGLRRKELASLTPSSFDLKSPLPTLTVAAACSKHRRRDVLPVHAELAQSLPGCLRGLKPNDYIVSTTCQSEDVADSQERPGARRHSLRTPSRHCRLPCERSPHLLDATSPQRRLLDASTRASSPRRHQDDAPWHNKLGDDDRRRHPLKSGGGENRRNVSVIRITYRSCDYND